MKKENSPALKKEIQAAQTFLSNLKTESQVALQKRQQIQSDTQKETDKLLSQRKSALEKIEKESQESLAIIKADVISSGQLLQRHNIDRDKINTEIQGKIAELNSLHEQLGNVKTSIEAENSKITTLVSQQIGIQSSIESLKEQISPLIEEMNAVKEDIKLLEPKRAELVDLIGSKRAEFEALLETSERDLAVLKDQKSAINREIQEAQSTFKAEREDLANRKVAADKRDDNLRAREYKVNRDEQMIEQNAGLLNL